MSFSYNLNECNDFDQRRRNLEPLRVKLSEYEHAMSQSQTIPLQREEGTMSTGKHREHFDCEKTVKVEQAAVSSPANLLQY